MIDLYGNKFETAGEYAHKLVPFVEKQPVWTIHSWTTQLQKVGWDPYLNGEKYPQATFAKPGLFFIYNGNPDVDLNRTTCLFVSCSTLQMTTRVYRFLKEYHLKSHKTERHGAGKKCRFLEINPNSLYYKFLAEKDFPRTAVKHKFHLVDQHVAFVAGALFNENKKEC